MEGFLSRDLYTKATYFEGVPKQEINDSGSKRLFDEFLLTIASFYNHTSMQPFTISNKGSCALKLNLLDIFD